jgi:lipopolysaccharide export system protein LptC
MKTAKQTFYGFFIFLMLTASSWYYVNRQDKAGLLNEETLSSTVDMTVYQLTVRQFDEQGLLANELSTPFMRHIPKKNVHWFQNPYIQIFQADQSSWEIRSQHAKSLNGGQRIIFTKDVIVHQNSEKKTEQSTFKTEKITYYPKEKKASTDRLVTFEQPGNRIQSTGMNAYLNEKRVELLHQARGTYAPVKG